MSDDAVRAYGRGRRFSDATMQRWLRHAAPDREAMLQLAERLRLGENQFRDLLDVLEDIASRQESAIATVIGTEPVAAVLARGLGRNETLRALRHALRRRRYPQLVQAETAMADLARRLRLPAWTRVEWPENLEGDELSVTIRAGSATELRARLGEVAAALARPEVDEMFRLLEGE